MADTFFGFNTTLPMDDDGGGLDDEGDYDALNDETFGEARGGDWESLHENLVRMDSSENPKSGGGDDDLLSGKFDEDDSDLDINFTRVLLDDCDLSNDDTENRVQLDPSVWASPDKSMLQHGNLSRAMDPEMILRQRFAQQQQQQQQQMAMFGTKVFGMQSGPPVSNGQPKMMSLADIERNMISRNSPRNMLEQFLMGASNNGVDKAQPPMSPQKQMMMNSPRPVPKPQPPLMGPPGLQMPPRGNAPGFPPHVQPPPHPMMVSGPPPHGRFPPGFPPNFFPPVGGRPMPPNMQMPFNNFNQMPPNFGPMRGPMAQPPPMPRGMPIPQPQQQTQNQPLVSPHFQQNSNNAQTSVNQFNQRLLQEIQQNHPLLSMNRANNNNNNFPNHQQYNNSNGQYGHHQQYNRNNSNGNVNQTEFDPYAGMMSQRDKHWLLGIQLMQLNTDTPYIDDFYYIVYKEREKQRKGRHESRAHADNKNNHPFTQAQQPNNHRGYAQLMFMSLKNGHHHQNKNGMQNRERKNSENGANKDKEPATPRTYTPLQFENSLGKLQCGSVTAPRKIIDMEVVGPDANNPIGPTSEISAQRKSRQVLLHIETMYKVVLKLEDLSNPIAITTALILKEKREAKEAIELAAGAAIAQHEAEQQQQQQQKNDNSTPASKILLAATARTDSVKLSDLETRADLLPRLLAGLTGEKVTQMMMVRKGRTLLKRALPHVTDCGQQKWEVWCSIYTALLFILKKEKDDTEGTLINLFYEFEKDLQMATMDELTKLARILQTVIDKMTMYVFECKFCISSIFALILHSEHLNQIATANNQPFDLTNNTTWIAFIEAICTSVRKITKIKSITASIDSESHRILTEHLKKFDKIDSDALLEIVTKTN